MAMGMGTVDTWFSGKRKSYWGGLAIASALLIVYFLLNYWTVSLFSKANSFITVFKVIIWTYDWVTFICRVSWIQFYLCRKYCSQWLGKCTYSCSNFWYHLCI